MITTGKVIEATPAKKRSARSNTMPYFLGLPLILPERKGALVFVRFGGPKFTSEQMPLATLAATHAANALEQNISRESLTQLEHARHRAQLQDDFIATISHELHSPLGFIKGYTTSLLRSDTTWDPATQQEFLAIIDEESDHLLDINRPDARFSPAPKWKYEHGFPACSVGFPVTGYGPTDSWTP